MKPLRELLLALALASACAAPHSAGSTPAAPAHTASGLRAVPFHPRLATRSLTLDADAWLNLELRDVPDESLGVARRTSPLHVLLWLSSNRPGLTRSGIQMVRGYVLWRDSVWSDSVTARSTEWNDHPGTLFRRLWGGPLWALGSDSIDVVVHLRDSASGESAWVRAPRIALGRVH
jgi:hypothetical protein